MNSPKDIQVFYDGAYLFFELEAEEVDAILKKRGLDADTDDLQTCATAVRESQKKGRAK